MTEYDINKDIYKQISGVTDNVTMGYYDDNIAGNAAYYTFEIKENLNALDKRSFACFYDIKTKVISSSLKSLYEIAKEIKDNLQNGEYLYLAYVTLQNDNYFYDSYIKKHTLTITFTGYVSNE